MSPELGSAQVDYKAIGQKMLHDRSQMTNFEKDVVFSMGFEYAKALVESKVSGLVAYDQLSPDMKKYLVGATLGRIITLHRIALQNDMLDAESISVFNDLKGGICSKLHSDCEKMPDESFNAFFNEMNGLYLDEQLDRIDPQPQEMKSVRENLLPKIVAENPEMEVKESAIKHTLD